MKFTKRVLTGFVAAALAVSTTAGYVPLQVFADQEEAQSPTGDTVNLYTLSAVLHFSPAITMEQAEQQAITAVLSEDGQRLGEISPFEEDGTLGGYSVQVSRQQEGGLLESITVTVEGLPEGSYAMKFAGRDFVTEIEDMLFDNTQGQWNSFDTEAVTIAPLENKEEESKKPEADGEEESKKPEAEGEDKTKEPEAEEEDKTKEPEAEEEDKTKEPEEDKEEGIGLTLMPMGLDEPATGTISATLQFHYPQKWSAIGKQNITAAFYGNNGKDRLLTVPIEELSFIGIKNGYTVSVTAKDQDGVPLDMQPNPELVYAYDIAVSGLLQDGYTVEFSGDGYRSYTSPVLDLEDYSRHVVIGTSNKTFTVGDANQDGRVDEADLRLVLQKLGNTDTDSLRQCDFNKDGAINVLDIAYVNHQIGASGGPSVYDTAFILLDNINVDVSQLTVEGNDKLSDIFLESTDSIVIKPATADTELAIPIAFAEPVEMAQVQIVSPSGSGAVQSGVAIVEEENGNLTEYPFGQGRSMDNAHILYTESDTGISTVTISLGKRVAVKKVTIRVTSVENQGTGNVEYAVVQQIKFLKDIVPENAAPSNITVRNLKAAPGSESITLTWTDLPNMTGYEVKYGTESRNYTEKVHVDVNHAEISGLKNLETYYFIVTPVNGSWRGNPSNEVSAMPEPSKAPSAPDMLKAEPMDGGLNFSWQKAKNALYYKVYCRQNLEGEDFVLVTGTDENGEADDGKITATSKMITGLTNGIEYELYVVAGNSIGESGKSKSVVGTPEKVVLEKPEGIPDNNLPYSSITDVTMTNKNNIKMSLYPEGTTREDVIKMVYDEDYASAWVADIWSKSHEFNFTFDQSYDMNYLIYVPRLDGKYRNSLSTYTIKVSSTDTGDDFITVGKGNVRNEPKLTGFAILPFNRSEVRRLKVDVGQWAGSPTDVSLSEILFYEYDPTMDINGQVDSLFANASYSALSPGVTDETITALTAQLETNGDYLVDKEALLDELKLAASLLKDGSGLGVMHYGITNVSGLQPLGVAAMAGNKITVYADIPDGEKVSVIATQTQAEAAAWKKTIISQLEPGRNVLTIPQIDSLKGKHGGSLYYEYSGAQGDQITLQVRRAVDIPTLDLLNWYALDEAERNSRIDAYVAELSAFKQTGIDNVLNVTEIIMPNVLLSIPADAVKNALPSDPAEATVQLYNNTLAWEEVMHIAKTTHGIDDTLENSNSSEKRQNVRYMTMFAGAFMYAAGSHIGIGYGSCGGMVKGVPVDGSTPKSNKNKLFGWGIAHEIGHNMDLLGKAEITNNIYSLMVQTYDGENNTLPSRLENSGKYKEIWMKTAMGQPGSANDVFVQLGMYWQLHLAYDDVAGSAMDFYNQFFKNWKDSANGANSFSYNNRVAVIASQTAGKDLTEFFSRWGMELSDEALTLMAAEEAETRAIWYLNDEARRFRLSGGAASVTKPSIIAAVQGDKEVKLTFQAAGDVLGYEILRNGAPIAFTDQTEYVDTIGTANNLTFTYTVTAISMLGERGQASDPVQIRIAYNKTVPASMYDYTLTGKTATFTMKEAEGVPVTGILVTGAEGVGAYTVTVKQPETNNVVTAKSGSYSDNSSTTEKEFLAYFNKPGADPSDTRMWTYDAAEVQVTNVPDGATVQLISYPGDAVSFYEGAFVGRLLADYNASGDIIKKDTLVVIGNYRGDPVFNTIMLKGEFNTLDQETGETTTMERLLNGDAYLFAELPEDQQVSDINDGFFLFVPDVQAEEQLQNPENPDCSYNSVLPARIKAEMYRTDTPLNENSTDFGRLVSDTLWYSSPADSEMPAIDLVN